MGLKTRHTQGGHRMKGGHVTRGTKWARHASGPAAAQCRHTPVHSQSGFALRAARWLSTTCLVLGLVRNVNRRLASEHGSSFNFTCSSPLTLATFPGTTAVAALLRGRTLAVANVGDSRAVLAERRDNRLVALDVSFDQTPFRCTHGCRGLEKA